MALNKLVAVEWMLALRWPGAVGLALLAGTLAYGGAVLLPERGDLLVLQARVAAAERHATAVRSGAEAPPQTASQRREQFYAALPAHSQVTQSIDLIFAAAAAEKLSLQHGEYTGAELAPAGLVRYKMTLPLQGTYAQIRRFLDAATVTVPGLALDDLNLQRQQVAQTQLEARVQLSLFLASR